MGKLIYGGLEGWWMGTKTMGSQGAGCCGDGGATTNNGGRQWFQMDCRLHFNIQQGKT